MKKKLGMLLAVLLTFCMTVGVFADAGKTQQVDYKTDYYMIVESPDGGVDMYSEADASSPKLNDELIPNGTAIHVEGEVTDEAGKVWVYAQLHGMFGFLEENYLKPATLAETVASELALYGSKDANYSITVNAKEDGSVCLYKGPGKKYGTVSGGCNIANGEKLYIDTEVDTGKDGIWGHTEAGDVSGWVNIAEATNTEESTVELVPETEKEAEDSSKSVQDGENTSEVGKAGTEGKDSSDVEAEPTGTPTRSLRRQVLLLRSQLRRVLLLRNRLRKQLQLQSQQRQVLLPLSRLKRALLPRSRLRQVLLLRNQQRQVLPPRSQVRLLRLQKRQQ